MAKGVTHLYDHQLDFEHPLVLPISSTKRVKIYRVDGEDKLPQYVYCPQWKDEKPAGTVGRWNYYYTSRKVWASYTMDGALAKLGVKPTGLWRVLVFSNDMEPIAQFDVPSKVNPTRYARSITGLGQHYEIIPIS